MPRKAKKSTELCRRFSICCKPDEHAEIERRAKKERRTVSQFMVMASLGYIPVEEYKPAEA